MALNVDNANEFFKAQAHAWNHVYNYIDTMCLRCAIELGIFEIIHKHGKPMTLSELINALSQINQSKSSCIERLMRVLVHSKFIDLKDGRDEGDEELYSLTHASMFLLKDEPFRASPLLLLNLHPTLLTPWNFLTSWFEGCHAIATPFDMAHGTSFYDQIAIDPNLKNIFYEGMSCDSESITSMMIRECKDVFHGLTSLVDVGGGTGTVAKALSNAFPHLKCTVFDLPHVVANLQASGNLTYVGGDMFEAIPPSNAILLKWILHNWNDEDCIKILQRCKESIPEKAEGGKVIIIDMSIKKHKDNDDNHSIYRAQILFDMLMMVMFNGKERREKDWEKIFVAAGFSHYKIFPCLGLKSLIEVYP